MCPPDEEGHVWACGACRGSTPAAVSRRANQLDLQPSVVPPSATDDAGLAAAIGEWAALASALVALPAGAAMHLAVVRCGVRYAQRIYGYVHTLDPGTSPDLIQGPLMLWDQQVGRTNHTACRPVQLACGPLSCPTPASGLHPDLAPHALTAGAGSG